MRVRNELPLVELVVCYLDIRNGLSLVKLMGFKKICELA